MLLHHFDDHFLLQHFIPNSGACWVSISLTIVSCKNWVAQSMNLYSDNFHGQPIVYIYIYIFASREASETFQRPSNF